MKKKKFVIFTCALALAVQPVMQPVRTLAATITAGGSRTDEQEMTGPGVSRWVQDEKGWWYRYPDGTCIQSEWLLYNDQWYYFNEEGYMAVNAWVDTDGKRYWVGEDGVMVKNVTVTIEGVEYNFSEDGSLAGPTKSEEELQAEAIAAQIVTSITSDGMSKRQKASAIYSYVRGHMKYTYGGLHYGCGDAAAALYAFRHHTGNCYEYYAMSKYMLEAAGMPNIMVTRASDADHYWNLVNVDGSWYHFDATPRRTGGSWCLVTTGQIRNSWGAHNFNVGAYPATP